MREQTIGAPVQGHRVMQKSARMERPVRKNGSTLGKEKNSKERSLRALGLKEDPKGAKNSIHRKGSQTLGVTLLYFRATKYRRLSGGDKKGLCFCKCCKAPKLTRGVILYHESSTYREKNNSKTKIHTSRWNRSIREVTSIFFVEN